MPKRKVAGCGAYAKDPRDRYPKLEFVGVSVKKSCKGNLCGNKLQARYPKLKLVMDGAHEGMGMNVLDQEIKPILGHDIVYGEAWDS